MLSERESMDPSAPGQDLHPIVQPPLYKDVAGPGAFEDPPSYDELLQYSAVSYQKKESPWGWNGIVYKKIWIVYLSLNKIRAKSFKV